MFVHFVRMKIIIIIIIIILLLIIIITDLYSAFRFEDTETLEST